MTSKPTSTLTQIVGSRAILSSLLSSVMHSQRVVFVGNPGSGKSTLLNALVGRVVFESGLAVGAGLTRTAHNVEVDGVEYADTPGLDDIHYKQTAAAEISKALSSVSELKVIFVCALEAGNVRSTDLATIDAVLHAIRKATPRQRDCPFSVIINKCEETVITELLENNYNQQITGLLTRHHSHQHVFYHNLVPEAMGSSNWMPDDNADLRRFIDDAPVITTDGALVTVEARDFEEQRDMLLRHLRRLQAIRERSRRIAAVKQRFIKGLPALASILTALGILCSVSRKIWPARRSGPLLPMVKNTTNS